MIKLVDGAEFIVQKKTVAATKLAEGDTLTAVRIVSAKEGITNAQIIMQSEEGYFLRFPLEEVTRKKKGAKPHFLKSGFEDATPQSEIKEIIRNGYKL